MLITEYQGIFQNIDQMSQSTLDHHLRETQDSKNCAMTMCKYVICIPILEMTASSQHCIDSLLYCNVMFCTTDCFRSISDIAVWSAKRQQWGRNVIGQCAIVEVPRPARG